MAIPIIEPNQKKVPRTLSNIIFLAAPFRGEIARHFYEQIGAHIYSVARKKVFLPHKEIITHKDEEEPLDEDEIYFLLQSAIKTSDLVLVHLNYLIHEEDVDMMIQIGSNMEKFAVPFYERSSSLDYRALKRFRNHFEIFRKVPYTDKNEAVGSLAKAVRDFYDSPLIK